MEHEMGSLKLAGRRVRSRRVWLPAVRTPSASLLTRVRLIDPGRTESRSLQ